MTIRDVIGEAEKQWPLAQAEDFDNVGLLCGNPDRKVTGILICHDALEVVVEEAIAKNCNLIVAFHPIIFSGLKSITGRDYVQRAVLKALENKIAIYALHTALDNDRFGLNREFCQAFGLKDIKILMPKSNDLLFLSFYVPREAADRVEEAVFAAGAGQIGDYDLCRFKIPGEGSFRPREGAHPALGEVGTRELVEEVQLTFILEAYKKNRVLSAMRRAHPYEEVAYQLYRLENENQFLGLGQYGDLEDAIDPVEFFEILKQKLDLQMIRHSALLNKKIKRVGVLGGSGASGIEAAKRAGCDIYVSGDFKYHDFFKAEGQIILADIGHFESEGFVINQLYEFFSRKFSKFAVLKTESKTNPVNYFI